MGRMGRMGRMVMGLWDERTILWGQWNYGTVPRTPYHAPRTSLGMAVSAFIFGAIVSM